MKRLLLILSPYLIFCFIFCIPFIFRSSNKKINIDVENYSGVDSTGAILDTTHDHYEQFTDSLQNFEYQLNDTLEDRESELLQLQSESKYKLIVGSFKSELKAQELSDNLSKEGYESKILENESLLRVCVLFSNSELEVADLKEILVSKGYQPWILKSN